MTNLDAPAAEPPTSGTTDLAGGWSSGAKTLFWGALLAVAAIVLLVGGSSSSDGDPSDAAQSAVQLGWVLAALSAPLILIGCIAIGVRLGLRDHSRD